MKMGYRTHHRILGAAVGLTLLLAACGGSDDATGSGTPDAGETAADDTESPTSAGTEAEESAASGAWDADAPPEWQEILDAAAQEDPVVVAGPAFLGEALAAAYEADTGLEMAYLGGSTRELNSRLDQEAMAGNVTIDVSLGGGTQLNTLLPEDLLEPIEPQLILPSAVNGENWKGGERKYLDNAGQYMLQSTEWVHGWVAINPESLGDVEISTWDDLLKPELMGRTAAYDPRTGGQGQSAIAYVAEVKGMDFIVDLFEGQEVTYTQDGNQLMEWVARGTYDVALGGISPDVERYKREGLPLEVVQMEDGPGALTGGFSVLKQPVGAPNPNAAQVFLNWWASGAGLDVYSEVLLEPSLRVDSTAEGVPDYVKPQEGRDYIDQYQEDWYTTVRPQVSEQLAETLGR